MKKTISTLMLVALATTGAMAQAKPAEDGYKFTVVKENPITPIKNQASSGTCWSYSSISFLESEAIKKGAPKDIFCVYLPPILNIFCFC